MADKLKTNEIKAARGRILRLLNSVYPSTVEVRTIHNVLIEEGRSNISEMPRYIDYLAGKGYVKTISEEDAAQLLKGIVPPSAFIRLTPLGVDLVEGTIEDPGVDV